MVHTHNSIPSAWQIKVALVVVVLAGAALAAGGRTWIEPHTGATAPTSETPSVPDANLLSTTPSDDDDSEIELITLRPHGFEPATLTRRHGHFMLAVNNRSRTNEVSLRLDRMHGSRLQEVKMPRGQTRSLSRLHLPPGEYLLSEEAHPEWVCRITLTSH
jgi:hypothetical protein